MAVFTFQQMRTALPAPVARTPCRMNLSLPAFSGLHSCSSRPGVLRTEESISSLGPQNGSKVLMMRHGRKVPRLGKPADQRKALLRSLTTEVIKRGRIKTTEVKAKAVRKYVDKMITLAKRGDLHARRQALEFIYDKELVAALFSGATARFGERNGGYCRVQKELYRRRGDGVQLATIELVD